MKSGRHAGDPVVVETSASSLHDLFSRALAVTWVTRARPSGRYPSTLYVSSRTVRNPRFR